MVHAFFIMRFAFVPLVCLTSRLVRFVSLLGRLLAMTSVLRLVGGSPQFTPLLDFTDIGSVRMVVRDVIYGARIFVLPASDGHTSGGHTEFHPAFARHSVVTSRR